MLVIQHGLFQLFNFGFAGFGCGNWIVAIGQQLVRVLTGLRNHHGFFTPGIQYPKRLGQGLECNHAQRVVVILGSKLDQRLPFGCQALTLIQHGMNSLDVVRHRLINCHTLYQADSVLTTPGHNHPHPEFG